jgi:integrase
MGSVFHKTITRKVPPTAEVVRRGKRQVARWRSGSRWVEAEIVHRKGQEDVIRIKSSTYYAKYRNADDKVVVVPTGCRDEAMARQFLRKLERTTERVRAGVVTSEEVHQARHMQDAIEGHIRDYVSTLTGSEDHRGKTSRYLELLKDILEWRSLADLRRDALELWLARQFNEGRSARVCNAYQIAASGLCTWLVDVKRLAVNPFSRMPKFDEEADERRPRRALSMVEFSRLVEAARAAPRRPAGNAGSKSLRPAEKLSGDARADLYLVLVWTGLRIGEMADVLVKNVRLDDRVPHIDLPARADKRRKAARIPLRRDLVELLRPRIKGRPPTAPLFDIPADLIKRFNADCKRAGIPKKDDRGKTADIHSLRMTFNTWLATVGVQPRVAQELMRHEDIDITMNVYTDEALFDLSAAVEALPALHQMLHRTGGSEVQRMSTDVNDGDSRDDGKAPS